MIITLSTDKFFAESCSEAFKGERIKKSEELS